MAHDHIDYAGRPQKPGKRLHLDAAGKEVLPKVETPPVKGSLLKWGYKPSSLQAATLAKAKAAQLAAEQKALAAKGKVPLAPARYPGQPTTAANLEILKNRILGQQNPLVANPLVQPALPGVLGAPVAGAAQPTAADLIEQQRLQSLQPGTDLFTTRFPQKAARMRLNAQQQQTSDAVLNMFNNRAQTGAKSAPLQSGWFGF
jgi:hypothetical protein